ncbi:hypothetical protein [Aquabacterium sp. J223]|nr:hypothetical protein [Aquabacterium sp. J223]
MEVSKPVLEDKKHGAAFKVAQEWHVVVDAVLPYAHLSTNFTL